MHKEIFTNRVNLFYFYSLCLYAFFLPSLNNFTTPILVVISVLTLMDYPSIRRFWLLNKNNFVVLALPIIFLLSSVSLLYSSDLESGIKYLTKSLPLLLFPLVLFKTVDLNNKQVNAIFKLFVFGCVLTILYSYTLVIYEAIEGSYKKIHLPKNYSKYFLNRITYHNLVSKNIVDHSIYFASYILFAMILLTCKKELFSNNVRRSLLILFSVTFVLLTPLIIAVSGLLIFSIIFFARNSDNITIQNRLLLFKENTIWSFIVFYLFIWKLQPHSEFIYVFDNLKYNLIITAGVIFSGLCGQIVFTHYSYRLMKWGVITLFSLFVIIIMVLASVHLDLFTFKMSNYTARIANNYVSIRVITENFLFGVGIGDIQYNLVKNYKEIGFRNIHFNEHNQYFRFWLGSGILSFLVYLFWLLKTFLNSILLKNTLQISIIIILILFCFTESVFARQMGTSFFLFFIFLLYFSR